MKFYVIENPLKRQDLPATVEPIVISANGGTIFGVAAVEKTAAIQSLDQLPCVESIPAELYELKLKKKPPEFQAPERLRSVLIPSMVKPTPEVKQNVLPANPDPVEREANVVLAEMIGALKPIVPGKRSVKKAPKSV